MLFFIEEFIGELPWRSELESFANVLNVFNREQFVNSEQWCDNIVIMAGQHRWESSSCWRAPILFMQKGPRKHIRGQGVNYGGGWYASSWNVLKSIPLKRLKMSQNVINHSEIKSKLYEQKGTSFEILKCYHAVIAIQHWVLMLANLVLCDQQQIRSQLDLVCQPSQYLWSTVRLVNLFTAYVSAKLCFK